ncbi:unnamed protein product, partial [Phaeothamnion confervicola]
LDVSGNAEVNDGLLKATCNFSPDLRRLAAAACLALDGSFLDRLAVSCPRLESLVLARCHGVADGAIQTFLLEAAAALAVRGGGLATLSLDGCAGLSDAGLRMVLRGCPRLRRVSLLRCIGLTPAGGEWRRKEV